MTLFENRKKAAEAHYALTQEVRFKVEARTAKYAALWLAEKIGLTDDNLTAYVTSVINANLTEDGFRDLQAKLEADSATNALPLNSETIAAEIARCLRQATDELAPNA